MKKYAFLLVACIATSTIIAQNIYDGLRYGQDDLSGTARFTALSGAFGALGGDISAFNINPAGSAVFLFNSAAVSLTVDDFTNQSSTFGTSRESGSSDLNIGNAGAVYVFEAENENAKWKKFSLGVSYHNQNNFDRQLGLAGTSGASISDFFVEQANGIPLNLLETMSGESISDLYRFLGETEGVVAQNAFLGFQGFVIDPAQDSTTQYVSNTGTGSFTKAFILASDGSQGKYTFNLAAQYGDHLFFGINLNSHVIDYQERSLFQETNSNANSAVKRVNFDNNLSVIGSGFSAQLGVIAKIKDNLRLGFAYDTPTWFTISEESTQYLETLRVENGEDIVTIVDPNIINIFADYRLTTPGKYTASAAYVFGKSGLISFDYSYKDYSNLTFRPTSATFFSNLNNSIDNLLKGSSTYRIGGEYRIKNLSLRGGIHHEESPFEDTINAGDRSGFSAGLGYNLGPYFIDVAYSRTAQESNRDFYSLGMVDPSNIDRTTQRFIFTLGLNL